MTRLAPLAVAVVAVLLAVGGPSMPSAAAGGERRGRRAARRRRRSREHPGPVRRIDARAARVPPRARSAACRGARSAGATGSSRTASRSRSRAAERRALRALPGVRDVLPAGELRAAARPRRRSRSARRRCGGQTLDTAGQGVKIGIIDSGIDPEPPVLRSDRIHDAAGLPEGAAALHDREGDRRARVRAEDGATAPSARARVQRRRLEPRHARRRHRRRERGHRRRAAAASRASRRARTSATTRSSSRRDSGLSPNANSPAIVAAIEAAVADGMDVINFSGGEPEIEPSRDIVALALDAAAAAGVVPVVAAGNDYNDVRRRLGVVAGQLRARDQRRRGRDRRQPDDADARGLLVRRADDDLAAAQAGRRRAGRRRALVGLRRRLGRALRDEHGRAARRGRRGAPAPAPSGVDGRAAQVRARAVGRRLARRARTAPPARGSRAAASSRWRAPIGRSSSPSRRRVSFGLLARGADGHADGRARRRRRRCRDVAGRDASFAARRRALRLVAPGDGRRSRESSRRGRPSRAARAPGRSRRATSSSGAERDVRRIPVWGRVTAGCPREARAAIALHGPGVYRSTTAGRPALVSRYRYPENPRGVGVTTTLRGPERVFRIRI